jgi:hypothetical protein
VSTKSEEIEVKELEQYLRDNPEMLAFFKIHKTAYARGREKELEDTIAFIRSRAKELHLTRLFDLATMLEKKEHRKKPRNKPRK